MGASVWVVEGSGTKCRICKKHIGKKPAIRFQGWNSSATVHSDIKDCDRRLRTNDVRQVSIITKSNGDKELM